MSNPEQPFDPRTGGQPWREHAPPPVDPQRPGGYPDHSQGYPPPPPVDPQAPVNYPDYSQGYPPPPPVDPQSPVGYFESAPGYPPSPPAFYPPPPSTLGQVSRPVTRSTCIRSTPTIVTCSTGNSCTDR